WTVCARIDPARQAWMLAVLRQAGPEHSDWHTRALDPALWKNPAALDELISSAPAGELSVSLLLALGQQLEKSGANAVPFLSSVQQRHPDNFWANLVLGETLTRKGEVKDAVSFFRAATAIRPDAAVAWHDLGMSLNVLSLWEEAE